MKIVKSSYFPSCPEEKKKGEGASSSSSSSVACPVSCEEILQSCTQSPLKKEVFVTPPSEGEFEAYYKESSSFVEGILEQFFSQASPVEEGGAKVEKPLRARKVELVKGEGEVEKKVSSSFVSNRYIQLGAFSLKGLSLKGNFTLRGEKLGEERVKIFPAIKQLQNSALAKKRVLMEKMQNPDLSLEEQEELLGTMDRCTKTIEACETSLLGKLLPRSAEWVGSNYFRDLLTLEKGLDDPGSLSEGVKVYRDLMDRLLHAPVNFREHVVEVMGEVELTMLRLGVMSDMSTGYVHLKELESMRKHDSLRQKKLTELQVKLSSLEVAGNGKVSRQMIVLKFTIDQLQSPQTLKNALARRQENLDYQMVQLVERQLRNRPAIQDGEKVSFLHLSLLNEDNRGVDPTGWHKDEGAFMSDMGQLFKNFEGASMVYDGKGPFVERQGEEGRPVIHLSERRLNGSREPVQGTLNPMMANFSVQGGLKTGEVQKALNERCVEQFKVLMDDKVRNLGNLLKDGKGGDEVEILFSKEEELCKLASNSLKKVKKAIKKKKSDYTVTAEVQKLSALLEIPISVGCMSAKDRTGVVCANAALKTVSSHEQLRERKKAIEEEMGAKMLNPGRPALEVAKQCNEVALNPLYVTALKATAVDLGTVSHGVVGKVKRAYQFFQIGEMFVKNM